MNFDQLNSYHLLLCLKEITIPNYATWLKFEELPEVKGVKFYILSNTTFLLIGAHPISYYRILRLVSERLPVGYIRGLDDNDLKKMSRSVASIERDKKVVLDIVKGMHKASPEQFESLYRELSIKERGDLKEKARQRSRKALKKKRVVEFTYPEQRFIAEQIRLFYQKKYVDALELASQELGLDQTLGFNIQTWGLGSNNHWSRLLSKLDDVKTIDRTGEKLHNQIKEMPYYDQIMELLSGIPDQQYAKNRTAACRRFAVAFGDENNKYLGIVDNNQMVRDFSEKKIKEKENN